MGKTSFSGPVFGAKSLIFQSNLEVGVVSTAAVIIGSVVIPTGEDWYITSLHAHRASTASTGCVVTLLDDSTSIATARITSSLADAAGSTLLTPDSGEYEGVRCVSGSSMILTVIGANSSAAALTSSGVRAYVYGYIRWNSTASTRTE